MEHSIDPAEEIEPVELALALKEKLLQSVKNKHFTKPQNTELVLLCGQMGQSLTMVTVEPPYAGETRGWIDGNKRVYFS